MPPAPVCCGRGWAARRSPFTFSYFLLRETAVAAVASSLVFLAKGRQVAMAAPKSRWRYLAWHAGWHVYGAAVLVAVTWRAQHAVCAIRACTITEWACELTPSGHFLC